MLGVDNGNVGWTDVLCIEDVVGDDGPAGLEDSDGAEVLGVAVAEVDIVGDDSTGLLSAGLLLTGLEGFACDEVFVTVTGVLCAGIVIEKDGSTDLLGTACDEVFEVTTDEVDSTDVLGT